jgi:hypothetical protein
MKNERYPGLTSYRRRLGSDTGEESTVVPRELYSIAPTVSENYRWRFHVVEGKVNRTSESARGVQDVCASGTKHKSSTRLHRMESVDTAARLEVMTSRSQQTC